MNRSLNDADDDFQLPQRGASRDVNRDPERRSPAREDLYENDHAADRELTLSTGTVLGIFFALAIICAVFFGFGYSMGRKSGLATADLAATSASSTSDTASTGSSAADAPAGKPAAGSPATQAIPGYIGQRDSEGATRATPPAAKPGHAAAAGETTSVTVPLTGTAPIPRTTPEPASSALPRKPSPEVTATTKPLPSNIKPAAATTVPPPTSPPSTATAVSGPIYVQVAAVSHKEDADNLLAALKRRGYSAFERNLETDKLIHVQVGPFNTKQTADAMRTRLQGDSYNAILK